MMPSSHTIAEFLRSPWFEYIVLPLVATAFAVFLKVQTRPLSNGSITKQDWAVGFDLLFAVILSFATYAAALSEELVHGQLTGQQLSVLADKEVNLIYAAVFFTILLWLASAAVRARGWKDNGELNDFGIFVPVFISVAAIMMLGDFIGA